MTNSDVESFFFDIPLEETINISCHSLFANEDKINDFSKNSFEKQLRMALQNDLFNFHGKIYKQTDGVAMSSPLGSSLANAFFYFHLEIWLNDCPEDFKCVYYRRYVDEIFVLLRSPAHLEKFTIYLNSKHKHIKFTYDPESNNSLPFLDILISRSDINFNNFMYDQYKIGLVFILWFRTFSIVSNLYKFNTKVSHLKNLLRKNVLRSKLVDNCIKTFLNKKFLHTPFALTIEKKELLIVLPYLSNLSLDIRTCVAE